MYYQFVDDETRTILKSLMESSYNYGDFVHQLVDRVCREDSTDTLVHLAAIHTRHLDEFPPIKKLSAKYHDSLLARPYILEVDSYYSENPEGYEEAKEAIERVLSTNPENWIVFRMYALAAAIGGLVSPRGPYEQNAISILDVLIRNNENLSCFRHELLMHQSSQYNQIDYTKCIQISETAHEVALQYDDLVFAAYILKNLTSFLGETDTKRAETLSDKVMALCTQLGHRALQSEMYNIQGKFRIIRGEFDAAIENRLESIRLSEKIGAPTVSIIPHNLAWSYNEIGDGEAALEWANMSLSTVRSQPSDFPSAHFERARALIRLGRLEEARVDLDTGHKLALNVGKELLIQSSYLITGLLEMAQERHLDALQSFERALEICRRIGKQNRINSCLLRLTECELSMFQINEDNKSIEYAGKWMERLEKKVDEKDIPGIRGLLLLLKAELRLKQSRRDEAEELMRDVRILSNQPGLKFLDDKVATLGALADHMDPQQS
jgi:tetratricopeptide (TPR) repeat protein